MFYPPPYISNLSILSSHFLLDIMQFMVNIVLVYILSVLIPVIIMPIVLPMVVLMARRKRMTDNPNARKIQDRPVAVMGGTVIMLVMCVACIVINVFYNISGLFPALCVMVILYIFGMLDDNIGLNWQFKLGIQAFILLLLYFGGNYGIDSLVNLLGFGAMPRWLSCIVTVFVGMILLNAVNFADGIDGLASGLGAMTGLVMGYWNMEHEFVVSALISFTVFGTLLSFFVFNVFSKRYKMYMGDSGSLVLGMFIFMSVCPDTYYFFDETLLTDNYFISFNIALLSAFVFDMVRVVFLRVVNGKSPFEPDRTHLHHAFVDVGMSHLQATLRILMQNILVIAVWYVTAIMGLNSFLQYVLVLLAGIVFIWGPYFYLAYLRTKHTKRYIYKKKRIEHRRTKLDRFSNVMARIVDGKRKNQMTHTIK